MSEPALIFSDLRFPEGARWHEDRLWFSDMHTGQVFKANPAARTLEEVAVVDDQPSGLGWLPDGSLIVSCMLSRTVRRLDPSGDVEVFADLSALTDAPTNDLVTTPSGRTYVGGFGYDLYADAPQQLGPIFRVDPDGASTVVEDAMVFPNGCVVLPGTSTLVVAETWGARLTAFEIDVSATQIADARRGRLSLDGVSRLAILVGATLTLSEPRPGVTCLEARVEDAPTSPR